MKLDPSSSCHSKYAIYITVENESSIYVYELHSDSWKILQLTTNDDDISGLVIPVNPTHIVFLGLEKTGQSYISDRNGNLYFGDFRQTNDTAMQPNTLIIRRLGVLLGEPRSLILDAMGMLYYIVNKFGVVVRWIPYKGVPKAEEHEILYFGSSETELVQIFFGSMGSVWVVRSHFTDKRDHCDRILYHYMLQSNTSEVI